VAHLRRHFKQVSKLKHGNNPQLAQVFIDLIDAAFEAHRQWRETQDTSAYHSWALSFKIQVQAALSQWLKAGYAAGLLLRSLRDKAQQWWYFLNHPEVPP